LRDIGRGSNNTNMEARVGKLEIAMEYVQRDIVEMKSDIKDIRGSITSIRTTDFRMLFGAIIFVAVGLAGLMAKGFGWL
jgi:hypothetical protein